MRIIRPVTITEAMLLNSNIAEDEYNVWNNGVTYIPGDRCIYSHKVYECLVGHTDAQPDINISGTTPKWLDLGATNRWKMFDEKVGSKSSKADQITLSISPGIIDSIAFLDLTATEIGIIMTDPVEGIVYTESVDLVQKSVIVDGYSYFFEPIITTNSVVLLGIPPYANAEISIVITYLGGSAELGTLAMGMQKSLGLTQYQPKIGITDYSKKETDTFGNFSVLQRAYSKRLECEMILPSSSVDDLHHTLSEYRATPVIWVGSDVGISSMIIYGFYRSFSINIPYINNSTCSLEIEGLS